MKADSVVTCRSTASGQAISSGSPDFHADFEAFRAAAGGFTQYEAYRAGREHQVALAESALLSAAKAQKNAIDILFAQLIGLKPDYMPSKSPAWSAFVQANKAIQDAEGVRL